MIHLVNSQIVFASACLKNLDCIGLNLKEKSSIAQHHIMHCYSFLKELNEFDSDRLYIYTLYFETHCVTPVYYYKRRQSRNSYKNEV